MSNREDWRPWEEGFQALRLRDCCAAADAFFEAVRLDLDGLRAGVESGFPRSTSPSGASHARPEGMPESDAVASAVRGTADLVASVLESHGDAAGALDVLEFAYEAGRRDADLIVLYLTLLLAAGEWAAAAPVLDEASLHEPHRPEYAALRRRLRAHRATSTPSRALTYVKGRNTDAQARSPRRAEARTP